jgi:hypothetical protein
MERQPDSEEGYVYILGVKDIDLPVCKIGKTTRDPVVRCTEINKSSTGDFLWEVMHSVAVNDCHKFESLVHAKLVPLRQRGREFFNIHPNDAIVAIRSILESAADLRVVMITADPKRDLVVLPRSSRPRKHSSRPDRDTAYTHLLDGFAQLLNVKGRPFGQLNKPEFGVSDGREGVQWNLKIYPDDERACIGVNLEGMAYRDWPIASLIRSELAGPKLPRLARHLGNSEDISVRFARDAWQVTSRPNILEQLLGGREFRLSELTEAKWRVILDEAIRCLDANKDYRGRARQAVTRIKDGRPEASPTDMDVSPHLTIWTAIDTSLDSTDELSSAIERLKPVHAWVAEASGA